MTEFCALAIKSTLIPPITTFKRKKEVESGWKDLREKFQFSLAFFLHRLEKPSDLQSEGLCFFWLARHRSVHFHSERMEISPPHF